IRGVFKRRAAQVKFLFFNYRFNRQQLVSTWSLNQHGFELGVDNVYLVETTYRLVFGVHALTGWSCTFGASNEAVNQVVTNVVSAFPGRSLRKASPRAYNFLFTEVVVADALATGYYTFREKEVVGAWSGFSQDPSWEGTHDVRHNFL